MKLPPRLGGGELAHGAASAHAARWPTLRAGRKSPGCGRFTATHRTRRRTLVSRYGSPSRELRLLVLVVALGAAGLLLPGETMLIAAAALAAHGDLDIVAVIMVAAFGAIFGEREQARV